MPIKVSNISPEEMYSVSEAAVLVNRTAQTIRKHINERILSAEKSKTGRYAISGKELISCYITGTKNRSLLK
jgi:predicted transcriptional regulator